MSRSHFALLPAVAIFLLLFLLRFPDLLTAKDALPPVVLLGNNSRLQGFRTKLESPLPSDRSPFGQADIFLSIPFAQPPVDALRLAKPRPAELWNGTLEANSIPAACVPQHVLAAPEYSEDCLFLNVFRPSSPFNQNSPPKRLFPVLVFIHGGGFCVGGNFVEGYQNISNNFVSQGIVVLTFQYRLNFLGFFSDGTAKSPGNLGLWDQRLVLLWVRENIASFGGDPDRVTLWGQSAGAASIAFLSLSPHTRDLFHQAIQQSGSFLSPWALNDFVVRESMETAQELGCGEGPKQVECLRAIELDDLVDAVQGKQMVRSDFSMVMYNPRPDGDFVPANLGRQLHKAPRKPTMMGFNSDESLFLTVHYPASVFAFDSPLTVANHTQFGRDQLLKFIRESVQMEAKEEGGKGHSSRAEWEGIVALLEQYYAKPPKGRPTGADWRHFLEQYTALLSDVQFVVPILAEARMKAVHGWPVFLYNWDHVSREHARKLPFRGVVHGNEYPFTLGVELFGNYELDAEDRIVQAQIVNAFGSFVKTGVPSSLDGQKWPSLDPAMDSPLQLVRFRGVTPHLERNSAGILRRVNFWRKLALRKGFDSVRAFPKAVP